jgi:hypothetical protein
MSRIPSPASIADAPAKSRPLLEAARKQLGLVPNMFRLISTSPQALEGYLGRNLAHLDDAEITANRNGASNDPQTAAAVCLAVAVTRTRGHVAEADLSAVRNAGYSDAQVIEIVQHVALNTWTNDFNEVFGTEIDFPVVEARKAA